MYHNQTHAGGCVPIDGVNSMVGGQIKKGVKVAAVELRVDIIAAGHFYGHVANFNYKSVIVRTRR